MFGIMFTIAIIEFYIIKGRQASVTFMQPSGITINPAPGALVSGVKNIEAKCNKAYTDKKKIQECINDSILGKFKGGSGLSALCFARPGMCAGEASQQ